eukprot:1647964-Pleurochrysis_carterae.AAC.3
MPATQIQYTLRCKATCISLKSAHLRPDQHLLGAHREMRWRMRLRVGWEESVRYAVDEVRTVALRVRESSRRRSGWA